MHSRHAVSRGATVARARERRRYRMGCHVATCLSASQRIAACYRSGWCGRTIARRASGWPRSSRRSSPRACAMRSAQTKGSSAPAATALSSCAARVLFSGRSVGTDRSVSSAVVTVVQRTQRVLTRYSRALLGRTAACATAGAVGVRVRRIHVRLISQCFTVGCCWQQHSRYSSA